MEQRIGSNNQPLAAAAVDPSHVPGLTAPVSVKKEKQEEPEEIKPTESAEPAETEEPDEAAPIRDEPPAAEKPSADSADSADSDDTADSAASDADAETHVETDDASEAAKPDGPVFEASDRRAKIIADSSGVRLRLDDQECEFTWDEIGAIETESPRFGKRFTITVHTPDRRWYFLEIEAKAKSEHAAWEKQIDEVLDAYFDEGSDEGSAESSDEEKPEETAP